MGTVPGRYNSSLKAIERLLAHRCCIGIWIEAGIALD